MDDTIRLCLRPLHQFPKQYLYHQACETMHISFSINNAILSGPLRPETHHHPAINFRLEPSHKDKLRCVVIFESTDDIFPLFVYTGFCLVCCHIIVDVTRVPCKQYPSFHVVKKLEIGT